MHCRLVNKSIYLSFRAAIAPKGFCMFVQHFEKEMIELSPLEQVMRLKSSMGFVSENGNLILHANMHIFMGQL